MISDVSEQDFQAKVVERSKQVPVVVDFWAEWCGPCRTLGPALEKAVSARNGEVELAKLDTDRNPNVAMKYEIASIPAVKAFKDGEVVAEFIGAVPPARIEAFLNEIIPSQADRLAESGDEESLRKALELDPGHAQAAIGLSRLLLSRGEDEEALEVLKPFPHDFVADGLAARAQLSASANGAGADELQRAFAAWDDGDPGKALEQLQGVLASEQDAQRKDQLRRVMVAIFTELGADHPLARGEHRRRLRRPQTRSTADQAGGFSLGTATSIGIPSASASSIPSPSWSREQMMRKAPVPSSGSATIGRPRISSQPRRSHSKGFMRTSLAGNGQFELCWSIAREIASRFFASEFATAAQHTALRRGCGLVCIGRR